MNQEIKMNESSDAQSTRNFWSGSLTRYVSLALVLWAVFISLLVIGEAHRGELIGWGLIIPLGIILFACSFRYTIPSALQKSNPLQVYMIRSVALIIFSWLPASVLFFFFTHEVDSATYIGLYHVLFQLFITLPFSWVIYKWNDKRKTDMAEMKIELDQTHASFDFLRSQINPHFLFNALNAIYGTAMAEGAERTGEGIQKLGDIMRFMLHENMQEKIPLSREVDYLNNYISLQQLRIAGNPNLRVETLIEHPARQLDIAPMLLIPFVENAFKHGISLRNQSYIIIHLETKSGALKFNVRNSKHAVTDHDPEQANNGIGLNNVRQRLELLYPGGHELTIRETPEEFFVQLSISLI
jgi:two-component system LytT family sensor kinase